MALAASANGQSSATALERLLACPYFALNPLMYIVHFPECCRGGWNISKLKYVWRLRAPSNGPDTAAKPLIRP